jgi:hypothetical protein
MSTFPALGLPEAWKPLLRALADEGWEMLSACDCSALDGCRQLLALEQAGLGCYLSFWNEPEWCGNNLQGHGLTVATLTATLPEHGQSADAHALLLTGDWENEVLDFIQAFFRDEAPNIGAIKLIVRDERC